MITEKREYVFVLSTLEDILKNYVAIRFNVEPNSVIPITEYDHNTGQYTLKNIIVTSYIDHPIGSKSDVDAIKQVSERRIEL